MAKMNQLRNRKARIAGTALLALAVITFCSAFDCKAQTTLNITFEGPPSIPNGQGDGDPEYIESGVRFRPLYQGSVVPPSVVRFRGPYLDNPDNGSTYLGGLDDVTNTLVFNRNDEAVFGLFSVELADYSVAVPGPGTVQFIGYRSDGSVVTTDFTLGPLIADGRTAFETFYFGPEFTDLERVEVPSHYWWMDNLVVLVPEPSTWTLLFLGGGILAFLSRKMR